MVISPSKFVRVKWHLEIVPKIFKDYSKLFNWNLKNNLRMVDIGSGPGNLILLIEKQIPKIETENLPKKLEGQFNFAFSSLCFTYVSNSNQAIYNVKQLLKPGGELFFFWCKTSYLHNVYKKMNRIEKWKSYTDEYKNWTDFMEGSTHVIEEKFDESGLKVLKIEEFDDIVYEDEHPGPLIDIFDSIDIISERVPKHELDEYKAEFHERLMEFIIKENNIYKLPVKSVVVAGRRI